MKFCEQMTAAVKKYFSDVHSLNMPDEAIINIPLQWEGKVLERVQKLHEYLASDWKDTIQSADVILWATHSQGTPVSAILLRQLIEESIIQVDRQPICMLAMAGISHGPFPSLKGSLLVKVKLLFLTNSFLNSTQLIITYFCSTLKLMRLESYLNLWTQIQKYLFSIERPWHTYFKTK